METIENRFIEGWTAAERNEYASMSIPRNDQPTSAVTPSLVRETLRALRDETPEDEDLTRALHAVDGRR